MSATELFHLTTKDYTILEVMLERQRGRDEALVAILRRKVANACVMFRDDVPSTVVTLSSRVAYRVDDGPAETRIIAHDEMRGLVGMILPITNQRGAALLGLAEGQSMTIPKADGGSETLTVQEVVYQPEAARRERARLAQGPAPMPTRPVTPFLRVVHRSDAVPEKPHQIVPADADGFDDPGPSAA